MTAPSPANMTAPSPADGDASSEQRCAACPHRWGSHDAIGARFCAATVVIAASRGCVCSPDTPMYDDAATD